MTKPWPHGLLEELNQPVQQQVIVTGLELCQRLYPSLPGPPATALIDEGNQISRMAYSLIQRLGTSIEPRAW
jgi:hypothetical protein